MVSDLQEMELEMVVNHLGSDTESRFSKRTVSTLNS